jgi:hypothetical protein
VGKIKLICFGKMWILDFEGKRLVTYVTDI